MSRQVHCAKLNIEAPGLESPPFPGVLGEKIYENISKLAWQNWLGQQTMLINEYRLNLADAKARSFLREEMEKYFFGEGSTLPAGFTPE